MSILVAGVGNIFFGDDAFGSEVVRVLAREPLAGAKVEDFGIRGLHLAYELLAGYEQAILIDAVSRGGAPGTLYVIEPDTAAPGGPPDAHRMDLQNVFAYVRGLGGEPPAITLVGCEPASVDEGIGLSPAVAAVVETAAGKVRQLVDRFAAPKDASRPKEMTWSEV